MPRKSDTSDLEDGEIRDDYDEISDCSISEIVTMKQNLEDDIELLREEALRSMYEKEEDDDESLEEEQYRLEALKSLLLNMELEIPCENTKSEVRPKSKPKRKRKSVDLKRKRKKVKPCEVSSLSEDSEFCSSSVDSVSFISSGENKTDDVLALNSRAWYPKTEFLLPSVPDSVELVLNHDKDLPTTGDAPTAMIIKPSSINRRHVQLPLTPLIENKVVDSSIQKKFLQNSCIYRKKLNNAAVVPLNKKFDSSTIKKGKYKLVNKSRFSFVKTEPKVAEITVPSNKTSKSRYSINRIRYPKVTIDPEEFIIKLDGDDSSKEDEESKENIISFTDRFSKKDNLMSMIGALSEMVETSCDNQKLLTSNAKIMIDCQDVKGCDKIENDVNVALPAEENFPSLVKVKHEPYDEVPEENNIFHESCNSPAESLPTIAKIKTETSEGVLTIIDGDNKNKLNAPILVQAEGNLLDIRKKLLNDLHELDDAIKRSILEKEKLNNLLKKFLALKSYVLKFEEKIKLQQCRVAKNVTYMNSLFCGVQMRSQNCSKFKEICCRAGKQLIGLSYEPPDKFEGQILAKRKEIDFSEYEKSCL